MDAIDFEFAETSSYRILGPQGIISFFTTDQEIIFCIRCAAAVASIECHEAWHLTIEPSLMPIRRAH
jgi:hypothetical protein